MKLVKKAAKLFVLGFLAFNIVRPLSIPRLPPIEMLSDDVEVVDFS